MTGNNPFEDNPWSGTNNNGPRFGNAYEDDNSNAWSTPSQQHRSTPDPVPRMPSPSDYRTNSTVQQTSWNESNKTEYPTTSSAWDQDPPTSIPSTPQNAYQYSGTRYASPTLNNTYESDNAYSKTEVTSQSTPPPPAGGKPRPNKNDAETALPPVWDEKRLNPSKLRLLLRFLQLIASIGHLGFAAGASPYSGDDVPFDNAACFYFLWAVAILTIIWSFFHLSYWCYRRVAHGNKFNRVIMTGIDLLLAILWGIGTIVDIAKYPCSPGDAWCNFYNVSIFWGMLSFVLFMVAVGWDFVGACVARRK
ncbi:hypothetical protein K492DRAFT_158215 [Lichtheimia hyalospora FSU 10163]|nr:hypothetical protein K492DRAFT_158215 [Lichtheimia hyalospora FSU 10163]